VGRLFIFSVLGRFWLNSRSDIGVFWRLGDVFAGLLCFFLFMYHFLGKMDHKVGWKAHLGALQTDIFDWSSVKIHERSALPQKIQFSLNSTKPNRKIIILGHSRRFFNAHFGSVCSGSTWRQSPFGSLGTRCTQFIQIWETYVFYTRFDMSVRFFNQLLGAPSAFWEKKFHCISNFVWNNYSSAVILGQTKPFKIHCKSHIFWTFHVGVLSHIPFCCFLCVCASFLFVPLANVSQIMI